MSHDYDPSWDYPVIELSEVVDMSDLERKSVRDIIARVRRDLSPALGFTDESDFEVFFSEYMGLHGEAGSEVLAVYCNGTSSRPVVGFDLQLIRDSAEEEGLNWLHQFELSLAHELGHAYQESMGLDDDHEHGFDEDDAEAFGVAWADLKEIHIWLLNPELDRPVDHQFSDVA